MIMWLKAKRGILLFFGFVLLAVFGLNFVGTKLAKTEHKRNVASTTVEADINKPKSFSVSEFKKVTGVKLGYKQEYKLKDPRQKNAELCIEGGLILNEVDDGSLTLMVGQRALAYNIFKTDSRADHSERNCKVHVFNRWKESDKTLLHAFTNDCKGEKKVKVEKLIKFSTEGEKSLINYKVKVVEIEKGNEKEVETFSCELVQ